MVSGAMQRRVFGKLFYQAMIYSAGMELFRSRRCRRRTETDDLQYRIAVLGTVVMDFVAIVGNETIGWNLGKLFITESLVR